MVMTKQKATLQLQKCQDIAEKIFFTNQPNLIIYQARESLAW